MKNSYRLFLISTTIIFLGWIAKMHFMSGGDIIFRTGSIGAIIALIILTILLHRHPEISKGNFKFLFLVNGISLVALFLGLMLKVSHIMNTQLEKDIALDFIGLPLLVFATIINFSQAEKLILANTNLKILFVRQILSPWALGLISIIFYALYSAILARQ